ncbi:MAG: hypothetical protein ACUVTZ_13275 [Armatimonadota bacterium]
MPAQYYGIWCYGTAPPGTLARGGDTLPVWPPKVIIGRVLAKVKPTASEKFRNCEKVIRPWLAARTCRKPVLASRDG